VQRKVLGGGDNNGLGQIPQKNLDHAMLMLALCAKKSKESLEERKPEKKRE
jgi:hypothetical protein